MRIFNQIRKGLLKGGKLKDYLKYAIGEIILVVVGILLALQINNWNEERKMNKERLLTLEILKQSFEKNKEEIENTLQEFSDILTITNLRIKHTGPQIKNVSSSIIDSIRLIDIVTLELANNLNSNILIDNKSISLLNGEIRSLLLKYTSTYLKYKHTENNTTQLLLKLRENHQKYIALLSESTPDNDLVVRADNQFSSSYIDWLRDRENQNISVEAKWKMGQAILELQELNKVNNLVLEILSRGVKKN